MPLFTFNNSFTNRAFEGELVGHFGTPWPVWHHRRSLHFALGVQGRPSERRTHVGRQVLLLQPGRAAPAAVVHGHEAAVAARSAIVAQRAPGTVERRVLGSGHHEPRAGRVERRGRLEVIFPLRGEALQVAHES